MTTNKVITPTRGTDVARRLLGNAPAANYSSMDDYQQQVDSLEQEKTRPRVYNADKTEVPLLERIKTAYNDLEEYATRDGNDWITRARDEPLYIRGGANPYGSIMGHFNNSEPAETNNNTARYFTDLANRAANALTEKGTEVDKTSAVSSIWQQVKDRPALDYITLGYNEPFRLTEALKVVTKSDNGEELNKSEQQVLDAFHLFIDAEQMVEDEGGYSNSAVAGQGLAQVTDFVTQMGLSSALGKAAAKGASKGAVWFAKKAGIKVAKEAAQETAETAAKRFSLAAAKQTAIKAAKQLPSNIVGAAAQTPLMSGAYTNYANRTLQQYDIADFDGDGTITAKMARSTSEAERVYKSYISGFTEVFTEKLGNIMQPLKMLDLPAFSTMGAWFARANKFMGGNLPAVQQIRQTMSKYISFNDFRYEVGEEYINKTIEPLLTGEPERLAENWSPKSVLQTFYSTAAVCGAMNIATRTPGIVYDRYMSNDYKKKAASYLGNIENVEFRQELANAMARPTPAEQVEAIQKLDIMSVEPSDRTMALDYVEAQINRDLYRGVDQENGIKEKLDKSKQFFAEYHNPHTQSIELAQNSNGEEFAIMSNILEPTADGSVFVKNINTGQVSQTTMSELSNHQSMGGREYLTNIFDSAQSEATQATEQQTQTELVEQAQGAGLNAHQVIASNKGIDLDALEDRQVTLADGSTVQVKGVVRQGATTRIIASGINEQGDEVDTDVNVADIVAIDGKPVGSNTSQSSSQEQAPEPAGNNVATMPDEAVAPEIPRQKDGTPDYDAMSAQMFFDEYSKVTSKEEVEQELLNRLDNITSQMSKLESSKTTSVNEKVKNRDKIKQLKKKAVEISQVINSLQPNNTVPENEGIAAKPTYEFVVREITKLNKLSGANAVVFSDTNDLPDSIRKHMNGEAYLYDGVTMNEDSYIFAPSMQNADMIRSVYTHEVAAHRNIFVALGSDKQSEAALYCSIVDNIGISEMSNLIGDTEFSGYVNEYFNNPSIRNKIILGKEFVGYYAQQNFNDGEYQTIGSGEFIVNLSDDISLSDIDKILSTSNNKGDDQRITIANSQNGGGKNTLPRGGTRDMGQNRSGDRVDTGRGESSNEFQGRGAMGDLSGAAKDAIHGSDKVGIHGESTSDNSKKIPNNGQGRANSVEQAISTTDVTKPRIDPIAEATTPQARHEAVAREVARLNALSGADAMVFSDVSELPDDLHKFFDDTFEADGLSIKGKSYIFAPLMHDKQIVTRTYIHEVAGHGNIDLVIKKSERTILFNKIVDDIGTDAMLALDISELSEEVERFKIGELTKTELGREYVAYLTEKYFTLDNFADESADLFVDLSNPLTDDIIGQILKSTNNGKGKIGIIPGRGKRVQNISPTNGTERGINTRRTIGSADISRAKTSNVSSVGDEQTYKRGANITRSEASGVENNTGEIPEQDSQGANSVEQAISTTDVTKPRIDPIAEATTPQAKHEAVAREVAKLNALSGADAMVFNSFDQLPEGIRTLFEEEFSNGNESPAVTIGTNVFIYSPSIKDIDDVLMVYNHEVAAHRNVFVALGQNREAEAVLYTTIVDEIGILEMQKLNNPNFKQYIDTYFKSNSVLDKFILGKEYVGYLTTEHFKIDDYSNTDIGELLLDLSVGIDIEQITRLLKVANQHGTEDRHITVRSSDSGAGIYSEMRRGWLRGRGSSSDDVTNSIGDIHGDRTVNGAGDGLRLGQERGLADHQDKIPEQDSQGANSVEQAESGNSLNTGEHEETGTAGTAAGARGARIGENNTLVSADQEPHDDIRYRESESEDKGSAGNKVDDLFNNDLRKLISGNLPRGYIMKLGMPSDALRAAGVPELPIELSAVRLKEKSKQENHPFDLGSVINLPAAIANPIAVFDSTKWSDSKVILTELSNGKDNFTVILRTHAKGPGRKSVDVNDIISLYPKDHFQGIVDWINSGLLLWIDKEKASEFISVQWPNYIGNGDKNKGLDYATKVIKNFKNPTIGTLYRDNGNSENNSISTEQQKQEALDVLSKVFNTPVQILRSLDELPNDSKKRRAKGFYIPSTGQVTIVLPNNNTIADVQATFLHEVVAHKGMAELVGRENAEHFYDTIYGMLGEREKSLMDPTLTKSVAVEELFGKIAEGGVSPGMMRRVLAYVREFFRSLGIDLKISDNDIRYMLWRSANNLRTAKTASGIIELSAKNQAVIEELGVERDVVTALGQPTTVNELMQRIAKVGPRKFTQEELEREMVAIKTESITEGTFMQGPNGEATNLTEHQWLQVRSRAFINWFGDWQKVYRIEKLKNSTPVEITGKEITPSDDLKEYRKNALEFGKTLRGEYVNKDTGSVISLTGGSKLGGIRELFGHDFGYEYHLQSIAAIPQIIEQSIYVTTAENENPNKPQILSNDYYVCGIKISGEDYTVKAVVANSKDGKKYYDHKLSKIEKGQLLTLLEGLSMQSADNSYPNSQNENNPLSEIKDKRLLSVLQTNSSRVLDANFEPLVVYHGTNADFNIFDTDRGQDRASFFTDSLEMAAQFAGANGVVMPLFLNIKNPMISDAAGRVYGYKANSKMFDMDGAVSDARDKNHDGGVVLRIGDSVDLFNNEPIVGAQYYLFESSQIKSATGNNGEFNPENEDIRYSTVDKAIIGAKNKITYSKISKKLVDQTIAIKKFQELITKLGGVVDIDSDAHSSMYRRDSRIAAAARKYNIRYIEPLMEVVTTIAKEYLISKHDIEVYMLAKHSLERNEISGIRTYSDDLGADWNYEKVIKTISDFENKVPKEVVDELWKKTNKATNATLKMLHVSGLMTTAEYNFIMARGWEHYVPLRGWDFEAAGTVDPNEAFDYRQNSNKGISAEAAKKAKGRKTLAADPMANIWHIALSTIGKIESNEVNKHALALARDNKGLIDRFSIITSWYHKGSDGKWSLMAEPPTKEQIDAMAATKREIRTLTDELKKLRDQNPNRSQKIVGQIDALRETIEFSSRSKTPHISPFLDKQIEQNTIRVIENGVEYWVLLPDPELANVLRGPKPDDRTWIKVAGATTRYMSSVMTAKNPEFIARNFVRDVQQAAKYHIVDKDGNFKGFMKYMGLTSIEGANQQSLFGSISGTSIMRNLIGKADELTFNELGNLDISDPSQREILIAQYGIKRVYDTLYGMFLSGGGETGYAHLDSIKEIDRKLTRRITEGDLAKKWNALGIGLNNLAVLSENSTRFATFLAILDTGKGEKFAINYAKNATVNFNVKGEWAKTLGALYAFFNATVQGTAAQVRLAKNNPARYAASSMILAAAGYTLCKMIDLTGWIDDDDDILEYDRMNNICVPLLTTGKVIKIPLLQGARAYYGLGVLTYMLEHDRISVKEFAEKSFAALFDNASPFELPASWDQKQLLRIVMPTTSLPIYDVLSNSTYFGGTVNLESYFAKGIPDSELYKNGTLDFLKVATSWLNEVGGGNKNTPAGMNADGSINTFQNWLDISPSTVQHVVAGYTGGVGKFVQNVLLMVNSWLPGGEKLESKNIPIFNAFYGDVRPRSYDSEFWELKSNIENLKSVNRKNIKDGTVPGYNKNMTLQQLAEQQAKIAKQAKVMKQTTKQVKEILQQIEELPNGDPAKEQLTRQKQQLMKTAIQQYKNDTRN